MSMRYQDVPKTLEFAGQTWTDSNGPDAAMRVWYGSVSTQIKVSTDPENSFAPKRDIDLLPHVSVAYDDDVDGQERIVTAHVSVEWSNGRNASVYYKNGRYSPPPKIVNLTFDEKREFRSWDGRVAFFQPIGEGFFDAISERQPTQFNVDAPEFVPQQQPEGVGSSPAGWYEHPQDPNFVVFWTGYEWGEVRPRE
jgi:hypothetical protein